ncbi:MULTISPECIES: FecR family protein [Butyricimonas]|uniref:FecR family protein n=1 Tax=Butyricimonas TaxID=574697 RepID=UPI0022E29883|nr:MULTISPECIES: FecR domain-containing protein [Butyricimonas]
MEQEYKIAALIQRYVSGNATEEERNEVERWMAESEEHGVLMEKFRSDVFLQEQLAEHDIFDVEVAFKRFRKSKREKERRLLVYRVAGVAAVLLVVLGVAVYSWIRKETGPENMAQLVEVLSPGSSRATLILAGGREVHLNDSVHLEIKEQMAMIKVKGDEVYYSEDAEYADSSDLQPSINKVVTSRGGEYKLILSDGTKVWLNADSRFEFPSKFVGQERRVYVEGEVYFEVAKDVSHPFVVTTKQAKVRVLGTSFNVRAYPDEIYRTTLLEGCVEVLYKKDVVKLQPHEQWILDGDVGRVAPVNVRMAASWKNGSFAFDDEPLLNVFQELERWYDVHVFIANEEIREMKFTGIFPRYANMDKVLNIVELATGVSCKVSNRTIVISKHENKSGK